MARPEPGSTEKRLLAFAAPMVLMVLAIALHIPTRNSSVPGLSDFSQGAYIPLVHAERLLKAGHNDRALAAFELAAMRGIHCGRQGVFNRIRIRIGSAGKTLAHESYEKAWPFLARYALWSDDFDRDSRRVESWILTEFHKPSVFDYPVILNNRHTVWNDSPEWVTLWIPERYLPKERRELFRGFVPGQSASLPHGLFSRLYLYPLRWRGIQQGIDTSLELGREAPSDYTWYLKSAGRKKWEPLPIPGPPPFASAGWRAQNWSLSDVTAAGNGPIPNFQVGLIHAYQPLN